MSDLAYTALTDENYDENLVEELDDMLDRRGDMVTFVRDDMGNWYMQVSAEAAYGSVAVWHTIDVDIPFLDNVVNDLAADDAKRMAEMRQTSA